MKPKVLLVGSFLSNFKGTKGVSKKLSESELKDSFDFVLASTARNQVIRLIKMLWSSLLFTGRVVHIDVYSGLAFSYTAITSILAKSRSKKIIMTLRGGALPEYTQVHKKKVKRVLKRASYIQSPSKYLIDYFASIGVEVHYLPNPIDLRKFPYDRSVVKPYSLLWVRAFTSIYNPDIPVRVLQSLINDFPETTLTMIGPDKGMRKEVEDLAKELGVIDQVVFVGPVPNEELYKYYQTHQVFLNTTSYESFGVAVVEAAACGIPIVSNPVGEVPYLWKDGRDILFADYNEVKNYVNCISQLFVNDELQLKLSKEGKINSEQFDWELIKSKWLALLNC